MTENCLLTKEDYGELKLLGSENLISIMLNNVNDCIALIEIMDSGRLGKFLEVNEKLSKKLGYSRDELLNMTIYDTEIEMKEVIEDRVKHLINKGYIVFQTSFLSKEGKKYEIEICSCILNYNGKNTVLGIIRDLTLVKKLHETEERYYKLVEMLPEAVHVKQNGKIVFSNKAGVNLFGMKNKKELIGRFDEKFTHPDYQRISTERGNEMLKKKKRVPTIEQKCIRVDGKIIDVEVTSTAITYNGNNAILSVLHDITKRKRWEQKLQQTLKENKSLLEKAIEHDRQKTEFFSNISHEFKTPLNVILGSIQLLESFKRGKKLPHDHLKIYKYIVTMKQNCYRLLRLINNLIDVNKADNKFLEVNFCNYDVIRIVEDITLSVADFTRNKGLTLIFDTDVEEKIIGCDADKIERIMLNLLSNSIKFTEPGGRIEVNVYDKKKNIIISVKDTGIGIPKDKLETIFQRFEQVDSSMRRKMEGSGIGLSLVKSFVELHNGRIWVESDIRLGTQFFIEFPVKKAPENKKKASYINKSNNLVERINIEFSDIYS